MKRAIHLLIILILIDLVCATGMWFGFAHLRDKKVEEISLIDQVEEETRLGQDLLSLKRTLLTTDRAQSEITKYLYDVSEEGQIKFVTQIEQLGTTTGVMIETQSLEVGTD